MSNKPPPQGQPYWVKLLINLGGVALVAHETVVNTQSVRWPLLLVGVVMMGLASADLLDRHLSPRQPKEDD